MKGRNPYRAAGTFIGSAYVEREADRTLQKELNDNQRYPYFCAPRQNGKSSLIANTMRVLPGDMFRSVLVDLSPFDVSTYEQFVSDLLESIAHSAGFDKSCIVPKFPEDSFVAWLNTFPQRLVIFIDEVDRLYLAPFKERFLSQIRSLFNKRSGEAILRRLQFVLAGAVHPSRLIPNEFQSPFNVGVEIRLSEFREEELAKLCSPFCEHFNVQGRALEIGLLIHKHTHGHVYLSQLTLEKLWDNNFAYPNKTIMSLSSEIGTVVDEIVVGARQNIHFTTIYDTVIKDNNNHDNLLRLVDGQELEEEPLLDLILCGISSRDRAIRNSIYERVFGPKGPLELVSSKPVPTRGSLRRLLGVVLGSSAELEAFCLDYFPSIHRELHAAMTRVAVENLLLRFAEPAEVIARLREHWPEAVAQHEKLLEYQGHHLTSQRAAGEERFRQVRSEALSQAADVLFSGVAAPIVLLPRTNPIGQQPTAPLRDGTQIADLAIEPLRGDVRVVTTPSVALSGTGSQIPAYDLTMQQMGQELLELLTERDHLREERAPGANQEELEQQLTQRIRELRTNMRHGAKLQAGEFLADRYRLLSIIGEGGFATVWKAHDYKQDRVGAVKVLHAKWTRDPNTVARFERGARRMASLIHPHIVRVLDGPAEDQGFRYYVMEYLTGGSLADAVLRGRIGVKKAIEYLLQIGEALQHAHDSGLLHRDIKPGNILLDSADGAHLTDFDLVQELGNQEGREWFLNTEEIPLGTMSYGAPENFSAAEKPDPRTDVYSLGMTLAFVLSGRELTSSVVFERETFLRTLPCSPELLAVVVRATALERENRFPSAAAFAAALAAAYHVQETTNSVSKTGRNGKPSRLQGYLSHSPWYVLGFFGFIVAMLAMSPIWRSHTHIPPDAASNASETSDASSSGNQPRVSGGPIDLGAEGLHDLRPSEPVIYSPWVPSKSRQEIIVGPVARVYYDLADQQKALSYYEEALKLTKQAGDRVSEARTLTNIGTLYRELDNRSKALNFYEQALLLWRLLGDRTGEAGTLNDIGIVHSTLGDQRRALSYYEQALPLWKQVGDRVGEARTLNSIGSIYDELSDPHKALSYYEQALSLTEAVGDRAGEASILNNIGGVYSALGDQHRALHYFERARLLRQQMGDRAGEARTLNNIGRAYFDLGDKSKALSLYEQALLLTKQVGDLSDQAIALDNMAAALARLGRPAEAIARYREMAACYLARRPPATQEALGSLLRGFRLGLRVKHWARAAALLSEMDPLQPSEIWRALWRAQLAGYSGAADALQRYQEIARQTADLPAATQNTVRTLATAGELRARNRAHWPACPGVVITEIVERLQSVRLGLHVGDILLRYQGQCIYELGDLIEALPKTQPNQAVTLELWRQGQPQKIAAQGGPLGIGVQAF